MISFSPALDFLCGVLGMGQVYCFLWEQWPGALEVVKL